MTSRRKLLSGMIGLPAALAATRALPRQPEDWVTRDGSEYGNPNAYFRFGTLDGRPQTWVAQNAGRPYSCMVRPNERLLRLELRSGEQWHGDSVRHAPVERTMVEAVTGIGSSTSQALPLSTNLWWRFSFLIEPGPPVSEPTPRYDWVAFADIHSSPSAPQSHNGPIQFELQPGDVMGIQTHGDTTTAGPNYAYRGGKPLVRGVWHDVTVFLNMDPANASGRGGARVWLDGQRIYAWDGPTGFANDLPYPQYQIYRGNPSPQTIRHEAIALRFANHDLSTRGPTPPPDAGPLPEKRGQEGLRRPT